MQYNVPLCGEQKIKVTRDSYDRDGVFKVHTEVCKTCQGLTYLSAKTRRTTQQHNGDNTEQSFMIETI